jgi:hypothetical protein
LDISATKELQALLLARSQTAQPNINGESIPEDLRQNVFAVHMESCTAGKIFSMIIMTCCLIVSVI